MILPLLVGFLVDQVLAEVDKLVLPAYAVKSDSRSSLIITRATAVQDKQEGHEETDHQANKREVGPVCENILLFDAPA